MNIPQLLKGRYCTCGQMHTCDIEAVIIEKGAIEKLPALAEKYARILLVADKNTYAVCGDRVKSLLGGKTENTLVYECEGFLIPNEDAIARMQAVVTDRTDLIVGIGSGVIQDLCKYVSFENHLPYFIVATAPSMDGYASKGAAMIAGNMKVTYTTHVPTAILGDTDILKDAPMEMIQSGYGDILGKFSCLNDWRLSHAVNDEPLCEYIYNLTYGMLRSVKDLGPALLRREEDAIGTLTEALIGVGIAMAYMGNSRPASGSEHHLSHFFEVIGILKNEPYFMHGTDVAYAAVYTQRLREEILALDAPKVQEPFDRTAWEAAIRDVYADAAEGVIALQNKLGWHEQDQTARIAERWPKIREVLADAPSSQEMLAYLESVGLDIREFDTLYGEEKIQNALRYAKDLKDRYTVLWL